MKTIGILLAGGLSRRFGSPKAFAEFKGQFFYKWVLDALEPVCDEVIIVTRPALIENFTEDHTVITDVQKFAGLGPLAGILSAMEFVQAGRYVVMPCDMPYIDASVVRALLAQHEDGVTAVKVNDSYHPLVSVWNAETKDMLHKSLRQHQLSVMKLLENLEVKWVAGKSLIQNETYVFQNINTVSDIERSD